MSELEKMPEVLKPTGFIFHQSRCGSTLAANILASDPENLVFSESAPPATAALHCNDCSLDDKVKRLQTVIKAMGNSRRHRRLFFKFQSANVPEIELYIRAFPDVPWIYVYREPVEIMASHLKTPGMRSPCLRSKRNPPKAVRDKLAGVSPMSASREQYCAAHLAFLNDKALHALHSRDGLLGLPVRYDDLPMRFITNIIARHFRYSPSTSAKASMLETAGVYSKGRGEKQGQVFVSDSKTKQESSSPESKRYARALIYQSYNELNTIRAHPLGLTGQHAGPDAASYEEAQHIVKQEAAHKLDMIHHEDATGAKVVLDDNGNFVPIHMREPYKGKKQFEETEKEYLPYPPLKPLTYFLNRWPPDEPDIPKNIPRTGSLEVFDYTNVTQRARADLLRWNEVPFLLLNVPNIDEVKQMWASDEYLIRKFGKDPRPVTKSQSNHFMYFNRRRARNVKGYKSPTGREDLRFSEWLRRAKLAENASLEEDHYYLQLNSVGNNAWIADDLYEFQPHQNFFIADPQGNRGTNCRFGARSIIAEAHYDGGRNFIAMLRGAKRYILLPPSECNLLYLYPKSHPEGRHAKADWSRLNLKKYPDMAKAMATEVVLSAGQVLYVPSYWFHYIVSTTVSAQCNTRSGNAVRGREIIAGCGFY